MHTPAQWIHQHDFLLAGITVFVGLALFLAYRRSGLRWWGAWASGLCLFATASVMLLTPEAELRAPGQAPGGTSDKLLHLASADAVEAVIRSVGGPVLAEFYADLGFS